MEFLNYHHLRYFYVIAREGNLTRAAKKLKVSQSALSMQLKKLEESLDEPLFDRQKKSLILTESGRIAVKYAETIFTTGQELVDTIKHGSHQKLRALRVGAVATLSRNFQIEFVSPVLNDPEVEVVIRSGTMRELLTGLRDHSLDVVLANRAMQRDADNLWFSHLLAEQSVSLVADPQKFDLPNLEMPKDLAQIPLILPTVESNIRHSFDLMLENEGIRASVVAEIDDMAMLRLMARQSDAFTLVPPVVVRDELRSGTLTEAHHFPSIREAFYAITIERKFPNDLVQLLVKSLADKNAKDENKKGSNHDS